VNQFTITPSVRLYLDDLKKAIQIDPFCLRGASNVQMQQQQQQQQQPETQSHQQQDQASQFQQYHQHNKTGDSVIDANKLTPQQYRYILDVLEHALTQNIPEEQRGGISSAFDHIKTNINEEVNYIFLPPAPGGTTQCSVCLRALAS
jgi:hypothetical protein